MQDNVFISSVWHKKGKKERNTRSKREHLMESINSFWDHSEFDFCFKSFNCCKQLYILTAINLAWPPKNKFNEIFARTFTVVMTIFCSFLHIASVYFFRQHQIFNGFTSTVDKREKDYLSPFFCNSFALLIKISHFTFRDVMRCWVLFFCVVGCYLCFAA